MKIKNAVFLGKWGKCPRFAEDYDLTKVFLWGLLTVMKKASGTVFRSAAVAGVMALGASVMAPYAAADPAAPAPAPAPAPAEPAPAPSDATVPEGVVEAPEVVPAEYTEEDVNALQGALDEQGINVNAGDLNLPATFKMNGTQSKDLVVFGDSFSAQGGKAGQRPLEPGQTAFVSNCGTDMENWPKVLGYEYYGGSLGDWSCNGTGGMPIVQLLAYVESAIQYGDLGHDTKDVVLMYGGMDTFQWFDTAGELANVPVPPVTAYRLLVKQVTNRIKQVAPEARVTWTSYQTYAEPSHVSPNGVENLCLINTPGQSNRIPVPGADAVQEALRDNLQHAAEDAGANFIDVYTPSNEHSTCAPEGQRWIIGFRDPQLATMTNHPTVIGSYEIGRIIGNALGKHKTSPDYYNQHLLDQCQLGPDGRPGPGCHAPAPQMQSAPGGNQSLIPPMIDNALPALPVADQAAVPAPGEPAAPVEIPAP